MDDNINLDIELLYKIQSLLTKIQKYWLLEFEVPANPAFDNVIISEDEATTPVISLMNYLIDMATNEMEKLKSLDINTDNGFIVLILIFKIKAFKSNYIIHFNF